MTLILSTLQLPHGMYDVMELTPEAWARARGCNKYVIPSPILEGVYYLFVEVA